MRQKTLRPFASKWRAGVSAMVEMVCVSCSAKVRRCKGAKVRKSAIAPFILLDNYLVINYLVINYLVINYLVGTKICFASLAYFIANP
jgi:hypothetical protein